MNDYGAMEIEHEDGLIIIEVGLMKRIGLRDATGENHVQVSKAVAGG